MAEQSSRKQQNQAFLQELEKQRLNKPCSRIIDLRGKVAGECQAYEFGQRVHYLDDRAYLLVKQLMARFDGRYTNGVYEAVFKALKLLDESDKSQANTKLSPIFRLDQALRRSESRTVFATPVQIRVDDMLYHGHTIDLSTQAIRVSCKRTFSLQLGDVVQVAFSNFVEESGLDCARQVDYELIKIDHDANYTSLVLLREGPADDEFGQWLTEWLSHHVSPRKQDIDNDLLNLQITFYQRLWLRRLSSPLLWLGDTALPQPLLKLHLSSTAQAMLTQSGISETEWLGQLPLLELGKQGLPVVIAFNKEHNFSVNLEHAKPLRAVINWHLSTDDSQLLLLRADGVNFSPESVVQAVDTIQSASEDNDNAERLIQQVKQLIRVIDLDSAFVHSRPSEEISTTQISHLQTLTSNIGKGLTPTLLQQYIQRDKDRFFIRTPVILRIGQQEWPLETLDVSADGLSISVPNDVPISLNQRVQIAFGRWQTLTSKVRLDAVPYLLKNKLIWQGEMRLGLQRVKQNCPESLNSFFDWVIAQNQEKLKPDREDVINAAESNLFAEAALPLLESLPIFIGLNENGQRQIQLVGETLSNKAGAYPSLWRTLEQQLLRLGELIKLAGRESSGSLTTSFFGYLSQQQWSFAFEQDFTSARDKTVFLERALTAEQFVAMSCTVSALKNGETDLEKDLISHLLQLRQQRANRVRDIRQQLSQLIGMIELTDISPIIKTFYQG